MLECQMEWKSCSSDGCLLLVGRCHILRAKIRGLSSGIARHW